MTANLRLIATFVQAARRESFSGAAKALGISAGAVSQNIKSLEDQLGARLFTRTTRQVKLTPEGQRYLQRCAPALEALDEATLAIKDEQSSFSGRLRITSTTAFGRTHLLPVIAAFQRSHPNYLSSCRCQISSLILSPRSSTLPFALASSKTATTYLD